MIKFFLFIKKIHFVLIFIILEAFAIHYYANSTSYTKAKLITAPNYVVGGIYSQISGLNSYLHLKKENAALTARVALLENELEGLRRDGSDPAVPPDSLLFTEDSVAGRRQFAYFPARVINNSIIRQENYITLNRGYKTSGKIKGTDYFGSVSWDGASYEYVMLTEIAKYAQIHVGDTIVTTSHSSRFPPGLMIGTVADFELNNATYYDVRVKLHTDIAALNNVVVIKYLDAEERETLENDVSMTSAAVQ